MEDEFHDGVLEDDEQYVEEIINDKRIKRTNYYLVKFEDDEVPGWVKEKHLNCPDKLEEYWKSQRGRGASKGGSNVKNKKIKK